MKTEDVRREPGDKDMLEEEGAEDMLEEEGAEDILEEEGAEDILEEEGAKILSKNRVPNWSPLKITSSEKKNKGPLLELPQNQKIRRKK